MRILLDGATTTTTTGVVKWYDSIATHQNLGKTMVKTFWAPGSLDLLAALIHSIKKFSLTFTNFLHALLARPHDMS